MKARRQERIIELISQHDIETQEELAKLLQNDGYSVTQATVSRDIKDLKLEKVSIGKKSKYVYPEKPDAGRAKFLGVLKDSFQDVEQAATLVVIKTVSGMAMAAAAALDHLKLEEIVGTIAGDDTILCATRSAEDAALLVEKINSLIQS